MVSSTVDIVLELISSLLRLVVGIPPGMLCKHNWVLYAGPYLKNILKESWSDVFIVDLCELRKCSLPRKLDDSLLMCQNFTTVLNMLDIWNFKICKLNLKELLNCFWVVVW